MGFRNRQYKNRVFRQKKMSENSPLPGFSIHPVIQPKRDPKAVKLPEWRPTENQTSQVLQRLQRSTAPKRADEAIAPANATSKSIVIQRDIVTDGVRKVQHDIQQTPDIFKLQNIQRLDVEELAFELSKLHNQTDLDNLNQQLRDRRSPYVEDLVAKRVNYAERVYLDSHLETPVGLPSLEAKLLLSTGHVGTVGVDEQEVVRLIENASTQERKELVRSKDSRYNWYFMMRPQLSRKTRIYVDAMINHARRLKPSEIAGAKDKKQEKRGKEREIVGLVKLLRGNSIFSSRRAKNASQSADRIVEWATRQTPEIRKYATRRGGKLEKYLDRKMPERRHYIMGLIAMPGHSQGDGSQAEENLPALRNAHELYLYLESKRLRNSRKLPGRVWQNLANKIDALGDTGRQEFLRIFKAKKGERASLPLYLIELGIGLDQVQRLSNALAIGSSAQEGSTLWQIQKWVDGYRLFKTGRQLVTLLSQLKGTEYSQLRKNKYLLQKILAEVSFVRNSEKYEKKVKDLLGLDRNGRLAGTDDVDEAEVERRVELKPEHWALKIINASKQGLGRHGWSRNGILSLVTQTYYAAKRLQALEGKNPEAFTRAVLGQVNQSRQGRRAINHSRLSAAKRALRNGTAPTVDARLEGAMFRQIVITRRGQDLFHAGARTSSILNAIEDARGIELLDQWTNIDEFRELKTKLDSANSEQEKEEIQGQMNGFILDMKPSIRQLLRQRQSAGNFQKIYSAFLNKLADSIDNDATFKKAMQTEGMAATSANAEVLRGSDRLITEDNDNSGWQMNWWSAKGAERREAARGVFRELGSVYTPIKAGQSQQVSEGNSQEDLAKARQHLDKRARTFNTLKQDVKKKTLFAIGVVLCAACTVATLGLAPIGVFAASPILISVGLSVIAGGLKAGVEKIFEGNRYGSMDFIATVLQHGILAAVTSGAGELSGVISEASSFMGDLTGGITESTSFAEEAGREFADKALNVSAVEVTLRRVAQGIMDRLNAKADEQLSLPGRKFFVDILVGILYDSIRKTANAMGETRNNIAAENRVGGEADATPILNQLSNKEVGLVVANELLTGQNYGVFEATALPDIFVNPLLLRLKASLNKAKTVKGVRLDEGQKQDIILASVMDGLKAGYSLRELKLYFPEQAIEDAVKRRNLLDAISRKGRFVHWKHKYNEKVKSKVKKLGDREQNTIRDENLKKEFKFLSELRQKVSDRDEDRTIGSIDTLETKATMNNPLLRELKLFKELKNKVAQNNPDATQQAIADLDKAKAQNPLLRELKLFKELKNKVAQNDPKATQQAIADLDNEITARQLSLLAQPLESDAQSNAESATVLDVEELGDRLNGAESSSQSNVAKLVEQFEDLDRQNNPKKRKKKSNKLLTY
ncbi:hypothetical protein [Roseofilum casamattae]|uniref:Uncharacterized protein n=1 Tax=Roseofilum casamattae BLCC-M143 TaxID=3022442 RepID=A0ABT7BX02_9CYAN|nr:hypothetical protein [Roseofilum casamattae]MDJ1183605.1 hypothetical protein [Roseofilum casamattae BLCC-M143]